MTKNDNNDKRGMAPRLASLGLAACAVLAADPATAVDLTALFHGGVGHSDNIGRDPTTTLDEMFSRVGLRLDALEDSARLNLDVRSNMSYQWYEESFDSEFVGGIDGFAEVTLVEDLFTWVVEEDYGQVLTDPLLPSRPDNREDVNFFSTGPQLYLGVAERTTLNLGARYATVRFETRPLDNDRREATVSLSREIRDEMYLSLNGERQEVEFDDPLLSANNFDRNEYYIQWRGDRTRNSFAFDIGYTELELSDGTSDGMLARLTLARQLSPISTLTVGGGTRFSDQGNIFRFLQDISRTPVQDGDVTDTAVPFRNDFANIVYIAEGQRTSFDLRLGWSAEDYEERADLNRELAIADMLFERDLTRRIFTNVAVRFIRRDFSDVARRDEDLLTSLLFGYRLGPSLSLTVQGGRFERDSNQALASFTENFVFLGFNYIPGWGR
jgi:hypothetical protein